MVEVEVWRNVPGWPAYEASDLGRIASHWRRVRGGAVNDPLTFRIMEPRLGPKNRPFISLCNGEGGKTRFVGVGNIILMTFVGPRPEGFECCHFDDNPFNNRLSNLRWDTRASNQDDKVRNGKGRKKLTPEQVGEIKRHLNSGMTPSAIARLFGVGRTTIRFIASGRTWRHTHAS